jgi:DnaK suppressor protein
MEGAMKKSKIALRHLVLSRMYDQLADQFSIGWSREDFVGGRLSLHEIDAALAFKSDPRIEELRHALDRIENGTFGVCIACKGRIPLEMLNADPARRICPACEQRLNMSTHYDVSSRVHI